MAPKRKPDQKQQRLEEVAEKPVTTKRSKKGDLTHPKIEQGTETAESLRKAKLARKHQGDPAFQEKPKAVPRKEEATPSESTSNAEAPIVINRAPTLTLWVSAVAQREGHSRDSGLTFGKAIAGILAQSKGRSIGVFEQKETDNTEAKKERDETDKAAGIERIQVFGMTIKAIKHDGEYFATDSSSTDAMDPKKVDSYLKRAFGNRLHDAEAAFKALAEAYSKDSIGNEAYGLYEQFRPQVASGQQGWGKKGELDLEKLKELHCR